MMDDSFVGRRPFHFNRTIPAQQVHDIAIVGRDNSSESMIHLIVAFDALYIIGVVFLGVILVTVGRSFHIKRASTWFMFIFSWFLTSLVNLLILGQQTGPQPGQGICLLQATLIYGTPVFAALYAVAFLLQVHFSIRNAIMGSSTALSKTQVTLIHALPCFSFCAIVIETLTLGLMNPETVERDPSGMYCHLSSAIPRQVTAAITIAAMITFLILGFVVFFKLRRRWQAVRAMSFEKAISQPQISPDVATRVLIFSFCPIIALALSSIQYIPHYSADANQLNMILAVLPIVAGLIFGSQRDILRAWMNCLQRKERNCIV
ncbi:hypothetical protein BDN70DRAFT_77027 [Pholiota conissans]|uniref:Uncharacterized protein n=1 Tax=Pholiota conissans TaxID=109636 RepID=A0A9P5YYC7_9AGAR|nr:hypothetical protein BDN70DRAFT_77027 [Pholiota conissans]